MESEFSYKFFNTTLATWEAMYQAIAAAKKSVYFEMYSFINDLAGSKFVDLLRVKAKEGVDVRIIVDGFGSLELTDESRKKLTEAGAEVLVFNSLRPSLDVGEWFRKIWHRTHRKILIVDEDVAFVGGVNIEKRSSTWYDLHLKITGKVIRPLLREFAKSYARAGGSKEKVRHLLHPKLELVIPEWKEKIKFIFHAPFYTTRTSPFKKLYLQALDAAKESFNLITPYYVPDYKFIELISKAKKRGVKVNIILPWKTDLRFMEYMARAFYGITSKAGAAFYFLRKMNHAKAVSADNKLGMVGSANFTPRSFYVNHEAGIAFSEEKMVEDLNNILGGWKDEAASLEEMSFKKAGWFGRFKDWWMRKLKDYV